MILSEGSEMLEYWTKPPIDPLIKIYVFNYTNIQDVLSGVDKRIKLKEVGPYVYRERIEKIGLNFEGHSITFNVRHLVNVNFWGKFKLFLFTTIRRIARTLSFHIYRII